MKHMNHTNTQLSPEAGKMLEDRVSALHAKLGIAPEQETAWKKVEQAMRDNETQMRAMIEEKRAHANELNAVESLEKAQNFAQTHADNLGNVIGPFRELYNAMPEEQRKNADAVFREFRGMGGMPHHGHHHQNMDAKRSGKHAKHKHKAAAMTKEPSNAASIEKQASPAAAPAQTATQVPPASTPAAGHNGTH